MQHILKSVKRYERVDSLPKKDLIRGDMLRELILLVYLNNRYGLGTRIEVSKLKRFLGYSQSGIYSALDESGYFTRKGDNITLSDTGERYVRKKLLRQYRAFNVIGYFFVFVGFVLSLQWYLLTYYRILLVFDWYTGFAFILGGLLFRFALLPIGYWLLKIGRKV